MHKVVDGYKDEAGAIIVLLAFMIFAMLTLVGIAIDTSTLGTATAQARSNGRYAALAAIESYFSNTSEEHSVKFNAARSRLNEVAKLNSVISADQYGSSVSASDSGDVQLTAGKWYFKANQDLSNPCKNGENPPCFVPRSGSESVNAFKVKGTLHEQVKTFFAPFVGLSSTNVPIEVISTISPRQGCFLVDLSPSMTRDTHDPSSNSGAAYGFYLQTGNLGAQASWHDTRWNAMLPNGFGIRALGNPYVQKQHYQDDYRTVAILNDSNYSSSAPNSDYRKFHPDPNTSDAALQQLYAANTANYEVDFRRLPDYDGPQPLTTIMVGLKKAVVLFKTNSVAGDKMCLIFFDHRLSWPRVVRLTDNYEYIDKILKIRKVGDLMTELDTPSQHGLFPSKDSFTNILMAITEANRQFKEQKLLNPGLPVSQFMVLITDGLSNCMACDGNLSPNFDRNGNGKVDQEDRWEAEVCAKGNISGSWPGTPTASGSSNMCNAFSGWANTKGCQTKVVGLNDPNGCGWLNTDGNNVISAAELNAVYKAEYESNLCTAPGCQNNYQAYEYATKELKAYVQRNISPQQIPIHVMLVGQHVQPNTMDYANPQNPGKCLTDSELRGLNDATKPLVKGPSPAYTGCSAPHYNGWVQTCGPNAVNDFMNMSDNAPFLQANIDMYDIARMTRGMWAPLRRPAENCVVKECDPNKARSSDPLCRDMNTQVEGYMTSIMGQNPYTIAFSQ